MHQHDTPKAELVPQIKVQGKDKVSKLQKQFNNKVKKIDALKSKISETKAALEEGHKRVQKELAPIVQKIVEKRIEFVKLLDRSYQLKYFRKREKEKIAFLIEDICYDLIQRHGVGELVELYDKYAEMTFEEAEQQADEEMKDLTQDMLKMMFGIDLDAEDFDNMENFQSKVREKFEEQEQERVHQKSTRKKTKAQIAKEEKAKAEMHNISKASRRVYTDLVKLLHPDKEQDEVTRSWKEEVIKQVTQAYKQDDFFELLRLQMEFMKEQERQLDQLPEDQLKYYLKILNEQIKDLEMEEAQFIYGPDAGFYHRYCGTPKQMDQKFSREKKELKAELKKIKYDLQDYQEPAFLRELLKNMR